MEADLPLVDPSVTAELARLVAVMHVLRRRCPWDAEQTHESLMQFLVEETAEVIEAVESGDRAHMCEELGDLLLQIVFHAEIAAQAGDFDIAQVAQGITDKLIRRHPHVFADDVTPDDAWVSWEQAKRTEKQRTSSLDGISQALSVLARTQKVISRARNHRVDMALPTQPIDGDTVGQEILALVARAQASGVDADQACRKALRVLEAEIRAAEVVEQTTR